MKTPACIANAEVLCCASEPIETLAEASSEDPLTKAACALYDDGGPAARRGLEHWIVSDWLAGKLTENAESVDVDFAGPIIWGRSTTRQAIECDDVIVPIAEENCA